ncbi:MAG TPA: hypothetical protein VFV51_10970 [Vicinamibacterales bacterium]|nr:hypothetical protein [Vicinamibacterales bacterium]
MKQLAAAVLLISMVGTAHAQEACKMEMNVAPMTLAAMYAKSEKIAKGWQADAVPARIGNTSMGPLDAAGKSEAWNLNFYSASANAFVSISTFRGMFTCYAQPGSAGRVPDLAPGFFRDGAKLYAIAKDKGAHLIAEGYTVSIQTAAAPDTNHATWYINYAKADGTSAQRIVIVDANTGAVEKVLD